MIVYLMLTYVLHYSFVLDLGPNKVNRLRGRSLPAVVRTNFLKLKPIASVDDRLYKLMIIAEAFKPKLWVFGLGVQLATWQNYSV